ncbi:pyridoxine kinase [Acrasis kona]|uniref:pyridoxal kinase n=1 Tax=Acrasis kona TaxID=1008807 RepID=A0AAW2ZHG5_9EUKA
MDTSEQINGRVLSIQSHVVHGYVGNRAAVLPLQLLGYDVDFINSVQFSNHSGYKNGLTGQRLTGQDVLDLSVGLEKNSLDNDYTHLLTGYIGTVSFLSCVMSLVDKLKAKNKGLMYVCDPVLGDDGNLYVPEELVQVYRDDLIKRADVVTPNQFEAEKLSQIKINTHDDAIKVIEWFHNKGVPLVVLTSCSLQDRQNLTLIASRSTTNEKYEIEFPKIQGFFTGTGDMTAALLLAWSNIHKDDLKLAIEKAIAGVQSVLHNTPSGEELHLIQSRKLIPNPKVTHFAKAIN